MTYFSIFYFFLKKPSFLISTNQTCFLFQKYKKIVFSLYSQKQVFENRKQKPLPNTTLAVLSNGIERVVTHYALTDKQSHSSTKK